LMRCLLLAGEYCDNVILSTEKNLRCHGSDPSVASAPSG
jgi:hypothetical protein